MDNESPQLIERMKQEETERTRQEKAGRPLPGYTQFVPLIPNGIGCKIIGMGAAATLIGFSLLPWALSPWEASKSATGLQMALGSTFSPLRELVPGLLGYSPSTPGAWMYLVPIAAILMFVGVLVVGGRSLEWRRAYWMAIAIAGLISFYPFYRLFSDNTLWVLTQDSAFQYQVRSSGVGFFVSLASITIMFIGAMGGMVGRHIWHAQK